MSYVSKDIAATLHREGKPWVVRLEYVGTNYDNESGQSSKFWEARGSNGSVSIAYGKIGTNGRSIHKDWYYFDEKYYEKCNKGYSYCASTQHKVEAEKTQPVSLVGPYALIRNVRETADGYTAYDSDGDFLMTLTKEGFEEISPLLENVG